VDTGEVKDSNPKRSAMLNPRIPRVFGILSAYMDNTLQNFMSGGGLWLFFLVPGFFIILMLWSIFWKGLALWHSARRNEGIWFIIMLFFNTAGILEIIYIFLVAKVPTNELFGKKSDSPPPSTT